MQLRPPMAFGSGVVSAPTRFQGDTAGKPDMIQTMVRLLREGHISQEEFQLMLDGHLALASKETRGNAGSSIDREEIDRAVRRIRAIDASILRSVRFGPR